MIAMSRFVELDDAARKELRRLLVGVAIGVTIYVVGGVGANLYVGDTRTAALAVPAGLVLAAIGALGSLWLVHQSTERRIREKNEATLSAIMESALRVCPACSFSLLSAEVACPICECNLLRAGRWGLAYGEAPFGGGDHE